jgi:hypothetical protein
MSLIGNWSWGNGITKVGIPIKIAARWLINHHPRDKCGNPLPLNSHPREFLITLIACGDVKVIPIGTHNQYLTICSKEYDKLITKRA